LSQNDPTDHALAAIASILDYPEFYREAEKASVEDKSVTLVPEEADGYSKIGPGPMAAIRFKWSVRLADDGAYYVDETIGENSVPAVTGPMTKDAAIRLVDARESEARRRFEELKSEMAGRSAAALVLQNSSGQF
jgi:hypothetical protein